LRSLVFLFSGIALAYPSASAQSQIPPSLPSPVVAPDVSPEPEFSVPQLIELAQKNNPRGLIAAQSLIAAQERARASRAPANSILQLIPGFTGDRQARDEEVILSQPLDLFGLRRARSSVASAEVSRAQAERDASIRSLIIDVKTAATTLFAAQEAEKLEQVQVESASQFRSAAARRAELGDVPPIQVQRAELEHLRAQNDLSNATTNRLMQRVALNLLIGEPPSAPLRVALPIDAGATSFLRVPANAPLPLESATSALMSSATNSPDTQPLNTSSLSSRPDILSAQAGLSIRQAEARALRRQSLPTVTLQARRSAFFGRDGSVALRAVVTMPLFDFGEIKGQRHAAEAEVKAQQASLTQLQRAATAQVESATLRLQQGQQNVTRYHKNLLPLTLDLLRKTQIGYAQGASTYLEILEAQRTLRQIQSEYLRALISVSNAEIELDAAIYGGAFPRENRMGNTRTERGEQQ
jgi:cobalt-zinc-cadmium efflux system outer membrane protein